MQTGSTPIGDDTQASQSAVTRRFESSRPPCRFFLLGKCKFGDSCTFSHDPHDGRLPVCSFFERTGVCRYGNDCKFLHDTSGSGGGIGADSSTSGGGGGGAGSQQQHQLPALTQTVANSPTADGAGSAAPDGPRASFPSAGAGHSAVRATAASGGVEEDLKVEMDATDDKCGICLENIPASGKRFGLLNCDHVYCLECLRTWRKSKGPQKDISRTCPECRKVSFFLVPSKEHLKGKEKLKAIQAYKKGLSKLPCKYHKPEGSRGNRGSGANVCPFGSRCFYAHLDENGNDVKERAQPTPPSRSRRTCPYLRGAGGGTSRRGDRSGGGGDGGGNGGHGGGRGGRVGHGHGADDHQRGLVDFHVLYPFEDEPAMARVVPDPYGRHMSVIMRLQQLMREAEEF